MVKNNSYWRLIMIQESEINSYGEIGKVIHFFQEIDMIPRNSGNESGIINYLKNFACERNLEFYTDNFKNVIIKKKATNKSNNYMAFQSHMDMVCEKRNNSNHDFSKDSIQLIIKDDYIQSNETNIGADNGIGIAYMLSILDSANIEHPNLEMIFTSEEETSMNGAKNLNFSQIESNRIISLDAFSEDTIIFGCASNLSRVLCFNNKLSEISELNKKYTYQIKITGFRRWTFW